MNESRMALLVIIVVKWRQRGNRNPIVGDGKIQVAITVAKN